jgi:hypothetical protein
MATRSAEIMSKKLNLTIRATNGTPWVTDDFGTNQQVDHVLPAGLFGDGSA